MPYEPTDLRCNRPLVVALAGHTVCQLPGGHKPTPECPDPSALPWDGSRTSDEVMVGLLDTTNNRQDWMAASDVPDEAVEAALYDRIRPILDAHLDHVEAVTRADERTRVLDEVQAALRDDRAYEAWLTAERVDAAGGDALLAHIADYLRDTLGAGGEG